MKFSTLSEEIHRMNEWMDITRSLNAHTQGCGRKWMNELVAEGMIKWNLLADINHTKRTKEKWIRTERHRRTDRHEKWSENVPTPDLLNKVMAVCSYSLLPSAEIVQHVFGGSLFHDMHSWGKHLKLLGFRYLRQCTHYTHAHTGLGSVGLARVNTRGLFYTY